MVDRCRVQFKNSEVSLKAGETSAIDDLVLYINNRLAGNVETSVLPAGSISVSGLDGVSVEMVKLLLIRSLAMAMR